MASDSQPQPTTQENKYSMIINQKENYKIEININKKINIKI